MIILGIETSCDETAAAVLEQKNNRIQILSNIVASSLEIQSKYGGVVPEQAAREQLKSVIPVIDQALKSAFPSYQATAGQIPPIDAIAVTQGPGLIGSLLIGVETAKALSLVWQKPLIPVNHLIAHFYTNWVNQSSNIGNLPKFPALGLLVSGGHTDIVIFNSHMNYEYIGGTRDDAAGECFDKCARLLGLSYPGGPEISKRAKQGDPFKYKLPKPMSQSQDFDFSFSGLKTAVLYLVQDLTKSGGLTDTKINDLAASIENTICEILVKKLVSAAKYYKIEHILVSGGVAANSKLRQLLQEALNTHLPSSKLYIPPPNLCTDNGVSTATTGFFCQPIDNPLDLQANPNLSLSN